MLPASYRESHLSMWSHVSMKKTQAQAAEIHELNPQGGDGGKQEVLFIRTKVLSSLYVCLPSDIGLVYAQYIANG